MNKVIHFSNVKNKPFCNQFGSCKITRSKYQTSCEKCLRSFCSTYGHGSPIWYNIYGYEPNMQCQRCGKDLG